MSARRRIGIRGLLLAVNGFCLALPLLAVVGLRFFDDQLIRRTEAQLISQGVLIGEAWREAWLAEMHVAHDDMPRWMPVEAGDDRYFPIEPRARLGQGVLPPATAPSRYRGDDGGPAWRAGLAVQPILARAVRVNLAGARVLDAQGCVVASSGEPPGACLDHLEEVQAALAGHYGVVLRARTETGATPALESIGRRGRVRVDVAIPIQADGAVIGVVRMSRTAIDAAKALWIDRDRILAAGGGCLLLIVGLSFFLSRSIEHPLRAITRAARSIARGEGHRPPRLSRFSPEELRQMSAALDQTLVQLSDRAEYIAEFAANVSHELKTPIAGIRGAAELLADQWDEMKPAERERFIANIDADAERMGRLVSELLHLARIQSAPDTAEPLALAAYLEGLAAEYGETVRLRRDGIPARLRIPRDHLDSALRNLLDNAVRHGAGKPVELSASGRDGRVVFRVRDHGPGIRPGNRERVFQRFFTTERDRGGTGLGLAIVQAVAETRDGNVRLETGADGTCFELVL